MIYQASNERYLDIDKVLQTPAQEFLMYINFYIRKQELERQRIQKMRSK